MKFNIWRARLPVVEAGSKSVLADLLIWIIFWWIPLMQRMLFSDSSTEEGEMQTHLFFTFSNLFSWSKTHHIFNAAAHLMIDKALLQFLNLFLRTCHTGVCLWWVSLFMEDSADFFSTDVMPELYYRRCGKCIGRGNQSPWNASPYWELMNNNLQYIAMQHKLLWRTAFGHITDAFRLLYLRNLTKPLPFP